MLTRKILPEPIDNGELKTQEEHARWFAENNGKYLFAKPFDFVGIHNLRNKSFIHNFRKCAKTSGVVTPIQFCYSGDGLATVMRHMKEPGYIQYGVTALDVGEWDNESILNLMGWDIGFKVIQSIFQRNLSPVGLSKKISRLTGEFPRNSRVYTPERELIGKGEVGMPFVLIMKYANPEKNFTLDCFHPSDWKGFAFAVEKEEIKG